MIILKAVIACFALVLCTGISTAQETATPKVSSKDATRSASHDRPIGGVTIKLPAIGSNTHNPAGNPGAPNYASVPNAESSDSPPKLGALDSPRSEDPPTFFGEPASGKFAFVLDASGSMNGPRMATLRAETSALIQALTEDDEFDCVAYGGQFEHQGYTSYMWGALLPATEVNKASATNWVNGPSMNPGGMTPSYAALQSACNTYPSDLDKMFFVSDGSPGVTGWPAQIYADFPAWWAKFEDCELVAICLGGGGADFMQQLAALAGGTYIAA